MPVTCPQCGRSIETPAAGRSATVPLNVCPSCGKFAPRAALPEGQAKPSEKSTFTWLPPSPTGRAERS